jgi:hypothetical protein
VDDDEIQDWHGLAKWLGQLGGFAARQRGLSWVYVSMTSLGERNHIVSEAESVADNVRFTTMRDLRSGSHQAETGWNSYPGERETR